MAFSEARLFEMLQQLPVPRQYWLAYSGGLDSTVLLHSLARLESKLTAPVKAIHADHGLHSDAKRWTAHCRSQCQSLGIELEEVTLQLSLLPGQSVEEEAREARYAAFEAIVGEADMLLTAHHGDDQAETLLLQLLRGAGVTGLAAMPPCRVWGRGWLARPLLEFTRAELEERARETDLNWVEDSSNLDHGFDRNYLRHTVFPQLKNRWPAVVKTFCRSARHCAQAVSLLEETAAEDLLFCQGRNSYRLSIAALDTLSLARKENLLRHWVREHGLPIPPADRIKRILAEVITAREGGGPVVAWGNLEVRRFAGELVLIPALPEPVADFNASWQEGDTVVLSEGLGRLLKVVGKQGISIRQWDQAEVTVGFRAPGLSCTPQGRQGRRSFKRLCQDLGIPPWLRDRLPLVYLDGQLAALGDYCVCSPYAAKDGEPAVVLTWERPEYLK